MSSVIRVRGKKRNQEQYALGVANSRKRAQLARVGDGAIHAETLSLIERLPLEILDIIFTYSRNASLVDVSRYMRYRLNRKSFINKFIVGLFQEVGIAAKEEEDTPLSDNIDEAADCLGKFLLHPQFDSSFLVTHIRNWLWVRAKTILSRWVKDEVCLEEEDLPRYLKELEACFDTTFGPDSQDGSDALSDYTPAGSCFFAPGNMFELGGDCKRIRITLYLTCIIVIKAGYIESHPEFGSDVDIISICDSSLTADNWARLLPAKFCRAPFTQKKGNYTQMMLELYPATPTTDLSRGCLDRLSSGLAEALESGCEPAVECFSFTKLWCHPKRNWVYKKDSGMASKDHTSKPWQGLISAPGDRPHTWPRFQLQNKHRVAAVKGFSLSPERYLIYFTKMPSGAGDGGIPIDKEASAMMFNLAQRQDQSLRDKLLAIWECSAGKGLATFLQ